MGRPLLNVRPVNVYLTDDLMLRIDSLVGTHGRSPFIRQAVKEKLERTALLEYRDHHASVVFDAEDEILVGRLVGIDDVVGFHADSVADLKAAFHEAVNDSIETRRKLKEAG